MNNKRLMTHGPKGNNEFCFPETLNVPQNETEENIIWWLRENEILRLLSGQSISVVYTSQLELKNLRENYKYCVMEAGTTDLSQFQVARPESQVKWVLCPNRTHLVGFDEWHILFQIKKRV